MSRRLLLPVAAVLAAASCVPPAPPGGTPAPPGNPPADQLLGEHEFVGWRDNVTGDGRLTGTIPADRTLVAVDDPGDRFDPGGGTLAVTVRLRSRLTASGALPSRAAGGPAPSFNVVQKGRAGDPGGFWKLEIVGEGAATGRVHCVVGDGARSVDVTSTVRVDDGGWHTVGCRFGRALAVEVDGRVTTASAPSLGVVSPSGPYASSVWVGKKPGSTDPSDAFSGWVAFVAAHRD